MKILYPLVRPLMDFGWPKRLRSLWTGHDLTTDKFRRSLGRLSSKAVVLCRDDELVTIAEAARILERVSIRLSVARGFLVPAYTTSGAIGVTKESVQRDLDWYNAATLWQRAWRRVAGVLRWA